MTTKTFIQILQPLAIAVLLFALFYVGCRKNKQTEVVTETVYKDSITHYDSITYKDEIRPLKPTSIKIDSAKIYQIIADRIDGSDCCQDYEDLLFQMFAENTYKLNLRDDDTARIDIEAVTSFNQLSVLKTGFRYKLPTSTIINTTIVNKQHNHFALGGGTSYNCGKLIGGISLHASIGFVGKKHLMLTASIDPFARSVYATGFYKFGK